MTSIRVRVTRELTKILIRANGKDEIESMVNEQMTRSKLTRSNDQKANDNEHIDNEPWSDQHVL